MYNFLLCIVASTILNLVCIWTGFMFGLLKEEPKKPEFNKIFFKNKHEELEEAYIPDED